MKHILITGAGSFVGTAVEKHLCNQSDEYTVETLEMRDPNWKNKDFSPFDAIFHVAGIAHSDMGTISAEKEMLYRAVNTDLTIEVAQKAKNEGVKQFIFMSSAIVYGDSAPIGKKKRISRETVPMPANCYGDSKWQAELGLTSLQTDLFKVVILRPPMIYGAGCKGNFPTLEKMADKLPVFPKVENERSMLYIGNLVEFVRLMIANEESGIYFPCNKEYSNTSELVKMIADEKGKKLILVPGTSWILRCLSHFTGLVNKAFGNMSYCTEMGEYKQEYRLYSLRDSIKEIAKK